MERFEVASELRLVHRTGENDVGPRLGEDRRERHGVRTDAVTFGDGVDYPPM